LEGRGQHARPASKKEQGGKAGGGGRTTCEGERDVGLGGVLKGTRVGFIVENWLSEESKGGGGREVGRGRNFLEKGPYRGRGGERV